MPGWHLLLAFAISLLVLCGLIGWLQNVHIITNNGMYKSIEAEPWIADPGGARLDPSNYLYFPLYGILARGLDALGILKGVPWKQFAYLNALWASLATTFVYAFMHRLTGSARHRNIMMRFLMRCAGSTSTGMRVLITKVNGLNSTRPLLSGCCAKAKSIAAFVRQKK